MVLMILAISPLSAAMWLRALVISTIALSDWPDFSMFCFINSSAPRVSCATSWPRVFMLSRVCALVANAEAWVLAPSATDWPESAIIFEALEICEEPALSCSAIWMSFLERARESQSQKPTESSVAPRRTKRIVRVPDWPIAVSRRGAAMNSSS